ncbi:MAG: SpaH/EbpB family LPXTG-anchored major pilin [Lachnospiraceae bacterium]|jgi:fimbrial isopeptide formation D2 family protein/LPXTG-motif cell wall-anchored protein|nr:SpaH/EbpB family LPXTG-anchored major pilin [Lachnospiraceae bacterium]
MNKATKIKAAFIACITALTLCLPAGSAFADNKAVPPEKGSLTIHKYLMDDVSGANDPNDGNVTSDIPDGATLLDGIEFKLYKITIPSSGKTPTDGDYNLNSLTNPTSFTSGGETFQVAPADTASVTTGNPSTGIAKASELPQGFYLVVEQPSTKVTAPAAPFVVAVPMTSADGEEWITDVHVYPKNEDVSVSKEADKSVVELGGTVTWTVRTSVPADIAEFLKFDLVDELDGALEYVSGSVKLTGYTSASDTTGAIIADTNYTVTVPSTANSNTLKVSFNTSGTPAVVPATLANYKFIELEFKTTVNEDIYTATGHTTEDPDTRTVENQAKVEFTNKFNQDKEKLTNKPKVHTGTVVIKKIDANTGEGANVNGAEFHIATSQANALAGDYLKIDANGKIIDVGTTGYDTADDWTETTSGGTSSTEAIATFRGLVDYTETAYNEGKTYLSYWLVETKAPDGYNLLAAPVQVTFTAENSTADTKYEIDTTVKNSTDFTLPKTGGIGTILFAAAGITLMGIALILLIVGLCKKNRKTVR